MRSRIAHHIDFPDYTLDELMAIADLMLAQQMYYLDEPARAAFRSWLEEAMRLPHFANARTVRNMIDLMKLRQANRLFSGRGVIRKREPACISAVDVPLGEVVA